MQRLQESGKNAEANQGNKFPDDSCPESELHTNCVELAKSYKKWRQSFFELLPQLYRSPHLAAVREAASSTASLHRPKAGYFPILRCGLIGSEPKRGLSQRQCILAGSDCL